MLSLSLLFGFSFVFGSALNLLIWLMLGFRPRFGFLVSWLAVGEIIVVEPFGWPATLVVVLIALVMFWAMGEEHLTHMARNASPLHDVVGPHVLVVNTMTWRNAMLCGPGSLDRLPRDRRVVVCSFLRPLLAWHLRRRGFEQRWVKFDQTAALPVWVRDAVAAEPGMESTSAR